MAKKVLILLAAMMLTFSACEKKNDIPGDNYRGYITLVNRSAQEIILSYSAQQGNITHFSFVTAPGATTIFDLVKDGHLYEHMDYTGELKVFYFDTVAVTSKTIFSYNRFSINTTWHYQFTISPDASKCDISRNLQ